MRLFACDFSDVLALNLHNEDAFDEAIDEEIRKEKKKKSASADSSMELVVAVYSSISFLESESQTDLLLLSKSVTRKASVPRCVVCGIEICSPNNN